MSRSPWWVTSRQRCSAPCFTIDKTERRSAGSSHRRCVIRCCFLRMYACCLLWAPSILRRVFFFFFFMFAFGMCVRCCPLALRRMIASSSLFVHNYWRTEPPLLLCVHRHLLLRLYSCAALHCIVFGLSCCLCRLLAACVRAVICSTWKCVLSFGPDLQWGEIFSSTIYMESTSMVLVDRVDDTTVTDSSSQ